MAVTHRDRVLSTFRFRSSDRVAYDLMEGAVWPELMAHFRDEHGRAEPLDVLEYLDTDFRWVGMRHEPPGSDAKPTPPASAEPTSGTWWRIPITESRRSTAGTSRPCAEQQGAGNSPMIRDRWNWMTAQQAPL